MGKLINFSFSSEMGFFIVGIPKCRGRDADTTMVNDFLQGNGTSATVVQVDPSKFKLVNLDSMYQG